VLPAREQGMVPAVMEPAPPRAQQEKPKVGSDGAPKRYTSGVLKSASGIFSRAAKGREKNTWARPKKLRQMSDQETWWGLEEQAHAPAEPGIRPTATCHRHISFVTRPEMDGLGKSGRHCQSREGALEGERQGGGRAHRCALHPPAARWRVQPALNEPGRAMTAVLHGGKAASSRTFKNQRRAANRSGGVCPAVDRLRHGARIDCGEAELGVDEVRGKRKT